MKPNHVFIVGMPKTGTKLIINILEDSPNVHCLLSPETFFMGHLIKPGVRNQLKKFGDLSAEANVWRLVEAMYSGQFVGTYWAQLKSGKLGIPRERMFQAIQNSDRSDRAIFEIVMRIHPGVTEETILGEKTPGHLYHVPTLLEWFPRAKIIHTFRDPRAIMASEWRKRMERAPAPYIPLKPSHPSYSFAIVLHVTVTWLYAVRLHHQYIKRYPQNYYLSKFEDLIREPEESIKKICAFLGIDFHSDMLNPRQTGSSFSRSGSMGFDPQVLTRWQAYLQPWMNTWLLFWGKKYLREFDYVRNS